MNIITTSLNTLISNEEFVVTIGQFDGLHIGHMSLINKTKEIATSKKLLSAVITFKPRVDVVLNNKGHLDYLLSENEMIKKLNSIGIDYLIFIDFLKTKDLSSKIFLEKLNSILNIKEIVVGFDFTYGKGGIGNITSLKESKINVTVVDKLTLNNIKVGTYEIKQALKDGNITKANEMLGYNYTIDGILLNNKFYADNINILQDKGYLVLINNKKYTVTKYTYYILIPSSINNVTKITFLK